MLALVPDRAIGDELPSASVMTSLNTASHQSRKELFQRTSKARKNALERDITVSKRSGGTLAVDELKSLNARLLKDDPVSVQKARAQAKPFAKLHEANKQAAKTKLQTVNHVVKSQLRNEDFMSSKDFFGQKKTAAPASSFEVPPLVSPYYQKVCPTRLFSAFLPACTHARVAIYACALLRQIYNAAKKKARQHLHYIATIQPEKILGRPWDPDAKKILALKDENATADDAEIKSLKEEDKTLKDKLAKEEAKNHKLKNALIGEAVAAHAKEKKLENGLVRAAMASKTLQKIDSKATAAKSWTATLATQERAASKEKLASFWKHPGMDKGGVFGAIKPKHALTPEYLSQPLYTDETNEVTLHGLLRLSATSLATLLCFDHGLLLFFRSSTSRRSSQACI